MIHILGPKDRKKVIALRSKGVTIIDTTSHARGHWSRGLSPFFLGPVDLYGSYTAKNVENGWQFSKVFSCHVDRNTGNPSEGYFDWAQRGWNSDRAIRYPMGKDAKPEYSYWDGEKFKYIEARKRIYAPLYGRAVTKTEAWRKLIDFFAVNDDVYLWDFDGYDYESLGMSLRDVIECPDRKMGHAFVLAILLGSARK